MNYEQLYQELGEKLKQNPKLGKQTVRFTQDLDSFSVVESIKELDDDTVFYDNCDEDELSKGTLMLFGDNT